MSLHYLGKHEPGNCVFSVRHRHVSSPGECGWLHACGKARGRHFEHLQLTGSVHTSWTASRHALLSPVKASQQKRRKNVNRSLSGLMLLNKRNTDFSGRIKKIKTKKQPKCYVRRDSNPSHRRTLPIQPRRHSTSVVYCTYLTHFRTLQLYQCMPGYEQPVHAGKDAVHGVSFVNRRPGGCFQLE